jgi:predicted nucleic acid-binding protein
LRYILDANVALKCFFPEDFSPLAREVVLTQAPAGRLSLIAPDILVSEFGHGLRSHVSRKGVPADYARFAWLEFRGLDVPLTPSVDLADEALELALGHMGAFYDALYIALAIREDCQVLTADDRMIGAFTKLGRTAHIGDFRLP